MLVATPIKDKNQIYGNAIGEVYICGHCDNAIFEWFDYCSRCGCQIIWEDYEIEYK